jgi:RimJ/RimL family protein N-acetyltransferase
MPSFAIKPTLTGELVELRPVRAEDAPGLLAASTETLRLTGTGRDFSLDELERWYATRADHDDRLDLSIIERADGSWVGEVVFMDLDTHNLSCSFRIYLGQVSSYGRGLGTEATRLMLAHAFDTVGLHRISLEVFDFNPRARHVYEKVGFVHEGTQRDALCWDGEWVDAHMMAILAPGWAAHRGYPPRSRTTHREGPYS